MDKKKESIILSVILLCLILIAVGMSYAFLKTSFFGAKTSVLKVGSLSLVLDETSGNAITVEDGTPMYDSEGVKQDNYFTFALKNNGVIDSAYTIYLEDQPLDDGDIRVGQSYVHYNLEKDSSVLSAKALEGDQAIDKGIIKKNQTINYKMRLWFANDIPQSEENKVFKAKLNIVGSQNTKMMATNNYNGDLWNRKQDTVTKIVFQDSIKKIEGESESWDISSAKNKTVMARLVPNTDDATTNTLYIQGNSGVTANYDSSYLFYRFSKLTEIENINLLDTSNVTSMYQMFYECRSLTNLDVSKFDTSQVKNMSSMFSSCNSLTSLDLGNFDTSKVTNMSDMFFGCSGLTSLDVSNFNTSQVTDMSNMFDECQKLTSLDVSNFDTSKVTSMSCMFSWCRKLTSLDLSNFDTSNVTDMGDMFSNCSSLKSLDLSNFDTSNVTDMGDIFSNCFSLKSLDLSSFDTSQVTDMSGMFSGCRKLTSLDFRKATFEKVTSYINMFNGTPSTINIITKDATTKAWLEDKLLSKATVTIA